MAVKEILQFLRELQANNNREWFEANKERYKQVQGIWNGFCTQLLQEIGKWDADIAKLSLSQCTYRIYRDTRFSNDKSPYKTVWSLWCEKTGKALPPDLSRNPAVQRKGRHRRRKGWTGCMN